jgi:hypothetical protein
MSLLTWQVFTSLTPGLQDPVRVDPGFAASSSLPRLLAVSTTGVLALGADNFPSTGHATFDTCFRSYYGKNTLKISDIRQNLPEDADIYANSRTRKGNAQAVSCADYHANSLDIWTHPTLEFSFQYDPKLKTYRLPDGFRIQRVVVQGGGSSASPGKKL